MRRRFVKTKLKFFPVIILFFTILLIAVNIFGRNSNGIAGKVIARVVYTFPEALPGEKIELKRILTKEGTIVLVSSSPIYKTINDINELKGRERALIKQKYGNLSEGFIGYFNSKNDNDFFKVVIRFRNEITRDYLQSLNLSDKYKMVDNKTVVDSISKAIIKTLIFNTAVYDIDEYRNPIIVSGGDEDCELCDPDPYFFYTGNAYSKSFFNLPNGQDSMPDWARGQNVNIATFFDENIITYAQLDSLFRMHPGIDTGYVFHNNDTTLSWGHSQMAFHAMLHTALKAKLHHFQGNINYSIPTLISNNIQVASKSVLKGDYSDEIDSLTYNDKSVIVCIPSGNFGVSFPADGYYPEDNCSKRYNSLYIGGCIFTNNKYYEVTEDEYWQNWKRVWSKTKRYWNVGNPQTHIQSRNASTYGGQISDKETPHIVGPSLVTCLGGAGGNEELLHGFGGTSGAAPSMVGICASVISANPVLMSHTTENVRVALMVTAENIDAGYWDPLVDGRDGCGVVSGYHAALFAKNIGNTSKTPASPADTIGLAFGQINRSTPDNTVIRFNVKMPATFTVGKHFRAVLTWSSSTNADSVKERTCSDLNLEFRDKNSGTLIDKCYSFEDNIEVVDVENREIEKNHEYYLDIIISKLNFPANPTRNYIKHSLGWTWVKDFSGKKIESTTFTADTSIELLNRNIQCNNTVFNNASKTIITAGNRIELNPGVEIQEGAEFTAQIVKMAGKYDMSKNTEDTVLYDYSGNLMHAELLGLKQTKSTINRYLHFPFGGVQRRGALFLSGNDYYRLNKDTAVDNPEYIGGITVRTWIRFYKDTNSTGYIFTAMKDGEGYYLKVDDFGQNYKQLTFYISGGGESSTILYNVLQEDLEGWINYPPPDYAWGWVHVAVVWKAGDSIALCINGNDVTSTVSPTNVKHIPSYQCYIGADPAINPLSFKGGIDEVRIYSGPESFDHTQAEYHKNAFPEEWQGDWFKMLIHAGINGKISYDIIYPDIEDAAPLDTIQENSKDTMDVPLGFQCNFDFLPDPGKTFNHFIVSLLDYGGNTIHKDSGYIIPKDTLWISGIYKVEASFGNLVFIDDFETDKGWQVDPDGTDNATSGVWNRDRPWFKQYHLQPVEGTNVLVTGAIESPNDNDVTGGVTSIRSPQIQLPSSGQINLNLSYFFLHDTLATSDDYLQVIVEGSTNTTVLDIRGSSDKKDRDNSRWESAILDISSYTGQIVTILIKAADNANDNILEAGIDYIKIVN